MTTDRGIANTDKGSYFPGGVFASADASVVTVLLWRCYPFQWPPNRDGSQAVSNHLCVTCLIISEAGQVPASVFYRISAQKRAKDLMLGPNPSPII